MQKHDAVIVFDRIQMHIDYVVEAIWQAGEFEIVCGEQGIGLYLFRDIDRSSPG